MFCAKCGTGMAEDLAFCTRCGAPTGRPAAGAAPAPAAPTTAPPPAAGEPVLGVIPNAGMKKGWFGRRGFTLVVTPARIVCAELTSAMMREAAQRAAAEAKAAGAGVFGRIGAVAAAGLGVSQRYLTMPPAQALAEQPGNFAIDLGQVRSVHYVDRTTMEQPDVPGDLLLDLAGSGKTRFFLRAADWGAARQLLKQVLGDRVR